MDNERPFRRLPLRDLLTDAGKRSHDLIEHLHITWLARAADLRDLSRPVRRRSHYPTLLALLHSLEKLQQTSEETERLIVVYRNADEVIVGTNDEIYSRRGLINRITLTPAEIGGHIVGILERRLAAMRAELQKVRAEHQGGNR